MPWIESHQKLKENIKSKVTLKFKGVCQNCGKKGIIKIVAGCYSRAYEKTKQWNNKRFAFEIHHIILLSKGGKHTEENLTLICHKCHKKILHTKKGQNALDRKSSETRKTS